MVYGFNPEVERELRPDRTSGRRSEDGSDASECTHVAQTNIAVVHTGAT